MSATALGGLEEEDVGWTRKEEYEKVGYAYGGHADWK